MPRVNTSTQSPVKREVHSVTVTCHYCKKPGHLIRDCWARERANRITDSMRQNTRRTAATVNTDQECASRGNMSTNAEINYERRTNSEPRIESYRVNSITSSALKNIIIIQAPELVKGQANMLADTETDITLMKIGKVLNKVYADGETVALRGIDAVEIKTLCLMRLNILVGNKFVTYPCRLVRDDFLIEADGILGHDFMTKHNVCIKVN